MTTPQPPRLSRLRRPGWRDTRLIIGLLLVLGSVAVGSRVVATANDASPVYAARTAMAPGAALTPEALVVVRVRLGAGTAPYLDAGAPVPTGHVLLRALGAGEIVPRAAVGPAQNYLRRPVGIAVDAALPRDVAAGAAVDVWASERDPTRPQAGFRPPRRIAEAVPVAEVSDEGGALSVGAGATVHVLLTPDELPRVLDALANNARTAVVPVPGSAPGPASDAGR